MKPSPKLILAGAVAAIAVTAVGIYAWRQHEAGQLPAGIVATNGRIEALQVEIATKLAGRVVAIVPREGDMIDTGSVVAVLDRTEIEAQLRQTQAEAQRARKALIGTNAAVDSRKAELAYADQELERAAILAGKGYATQERLDQRRQLVTSAGAALTAALAQVGEAEAAIGSADALVDRLSTLVDDTTIRSPRRGRVQYRLVEPGAVLPAGGRIVTLLDLSDVSMTIFLPAAAAGRLGIGDEARIVLDAAPAYVFPATVSFVAAEAQFTPKAVETSAEREKLMFRVKLQAPVAMLRDLEDQVKSGLRGVAYLRIDRQASWPTTLMTKLPAS
jgi:HlyD family secretion protein